MAPKDLVLDNTERIWCLAEPNHTYLVYALAGGRIRLDLANAEGTFEAKWFDPRTGRLHRANSGMVVGGQLVEKKHGQDHQVIDGFCGSRCTDEDLL